MFNLNKKEMRKLLLVFMCVFIAGCFYSCQKKEIVNKKESNSITVDEEIDNNETDSDNDESGGRIEADTTKTLLYYSLVTQSIDFAQLYTLKYWVYNSEPDLNNIKNTPTIYDKPTGKIGKKGLRLLGSKSLPNNKWIVIEEPNDMKMYKFLNLPGRKGLLYMLEENVNMYPDGFYYDNAKLKVSGMWGTDLSKYEFNLYWIKYTGKSFATYPADKVSSADGWIHLYNRDGTGEKKYQFMRLPIGKYHFFIESSPGVYSSVLVEIRTGKIPYLKLAFNK